MIFKLCQQKPFKSQHDTDMFISHGMALLLFDKSHQCRLFFLSGTAGGSEGPEARRQVHVLRVQQSDESCARQVSSSDENPRWLFLTANTV